MIVAIGFWVKKPGEAPAGGVAGGAPAACGRLSRLQPQALGCGMLEVLRGRGAAGLHTDDMGAGVEAELAVGDHLLTGGEAGLDNGAVSDLAAHLHANSRDRRARTDHP